MVFNNKLVLQGVLWNSVFHFSLSPFSFLVCFGKDHVLKHGEIK